MGTTGNLSIIGGEMKFEWEIKNFLQLGDKLNEKYTSTEFYFGDASWVLSIYPYGRNKQEEFGYIGVFLTPRSLPKSVMLNASFSFKTVEKKNDMKKSLTYHFDKERGGYGFCKFISRSDLVKRKSELLPSDSLIVICNLRDGERKDFADDTFLDASAQMEEETGKLSILNYKGVRKLQQHLREISLNGEVSDVILKVKDQEFKSHRCILAARSPVFSAMMKNEMKESVTGIVDIEDIDPKTFSDFLSYLYTGSTEDITSENVTKLYTVADKYQVEVLKENCVDYMLVNVSIENFCDIFVASVQHDEEKLKETCIQYFAKHSLGIIKTCKWQTFLSENPIMSNELFIKHIELNKDIYSMQFNACHE